MYVRTDPKKVDYGCTGYRVELRDVCQDRQKRGGLGVYMSGGGERCVYVRTYMKGSHIIKVQYFTGVHAFFIGRQNV